MTAILHRPGEGREFGIGPDRITMKVEAADTGDAFSVIEYASAPGVPGPPLHVHRVVTETWYILEGVVTFVADGRTIEATPGTTLYVPTGIPHTFVNSGEIIARWIGIFSPGRFSKMLEDIGGAITPAGPDPERMARVFEEWDTQILDG